MSTRKPSRPGRRIDLKKRDAIVSAARDAFFRHGYAATSVEAVAEAAGVSKVTIYKHFGDKSALFTAAVEQECAKIRDRLLFDDEGGPLDERLRAFGRAMIAFLGRPEMGQFETRIAAETEREPQLGISFLEAGPRRMHRALSDMLARAGKRGEIHVDDPDMAAEHLAAMFKGLADLERRFAGIVDTEKAERRIDSAVDLFLRGYGGKKA